MDLDLPKAATAAVDEAAKVLPAELDASGAKFIAALMAGLQQLAANKRIVISVEDKPK